MSGKPEMKLLKLDDWMCRWKKFQSESDYKIEVNRQWQRKRNYALSFTTFFGLFVWTAAPATVNSWFSAPHLFDIGVDGEIKTFMKTTLNAQRRYTPNGNMRAVVTAFPAYLLLATLEHLAEKKRWNLYLKQQTVFGEQARRLNETGKIEDMLPINIKAPLSEKDSIIYAK